MESHCLRFDRRGTALCVDQNFTKTVGSSDIHILVSKEQNVIGKH